MKRDYTDAKYQLLSGGYCRPDEYKKLKADIIACNTARGWKNVWVTLVHSDTKGLRMYYVLADRNEELADARKEEW